jgi:hypothetical protein
VEKMTEYEFRDWQSVDLGGTAIEAGYGFMDLKYEGPNEENIGKIRSGVQLLELLDIGERAGSKERLETDEQREAYLIFQRILSSEKDEVSSEIFRKRFMETMQRGREIMQDLKNLIEDPSKYTTEELTEYQRFFAKLAESLPLV